MKSIIRSRSEVASRTNRRQNSAISKASFIADELRCFVVFSVRGSCFGCGPPLGGVFAQYQWLPIALVPVPEGGLWSQKRTVSGNAPKSCVKFRRILCVALLVCSLFVFVFCSLVCLFVLSPPSIPPRPTPRTHCHGRVVGALPTPTFSWRGALGYFKHEPPGGAPLPLSSCAGNLAPCSRRSPYRSLRFLWSRARSHQSATPCAWCTKL